jgi:hypothetical protein
MSPYPESISGKKKLKLAVIKSIRSNEVQK